jgi:hypothetical protein
MTMSDSNSGRQRFYALTLVTLAAAAMRLVPHPWNMTPIAGIALFGGAHFRDHRAAFGVPIAAMLVSDLVLALTVYGSAAFRGIPSVYLAFALTVCLGRVLAPRPSAVRVGAAAIGAALLFYLIANFAVWMRGALYPMTGQGLVACYVAALPYLRNAIVGNLVYTAIFFGGFAVAEWRLPALRRESIAHEVGV